MSTLYLVEQNTVLRKSGDRLKFCKKPSYKRRSLGVREMDILIELPCEDVDHVMIFGNIQVTTQAMHHLLGRGIEMALFTLNGSLLGQLTPPGGKNIYLRQKQYEKYKDLSFVLDISKRIVLYKIKSMFENIRNYQKNHPDTYEKYEINKFIEMNEKIEYSKDLASLRGYEGATAAHYFKLLGRMIPEEWKFEGRSRRPPKDPPNAVLSFGYTIVASELRSLLDGIGFDPYLGYFHQIYYGRPGLALDLLELFRHNLIDRLTLNLFNLSILKKEDFNKVGKGGIYLSNSGKRKFFKQYEKMSGLYRGEAHTANQEKGYRIRFQVIVSGLVKAIKDDELFEPSVIL